MSITLSVSIGYQRRRPDTQGDRLESRMDSLGLFVMGSAVTLLVLAIIIPKFVEWISQLVAHT